MDWTSIALAKKHTRREISIAKSHNLVIREINILYGGLGCATWDGGVILAKWIHQNAELIRDESVMELGAGVGIAAIVASAHCSKMLVTDYLPDVIENAKYNFRVNLSPDSLSKVSFALIDWNDFIDAKTIGVKRGHRCTKSQFSESYVEQTWFRCEQCFPSDEAMGVCEPCYKESHAEHCPSMTPQHTKFRCDCLENHGTGSEYKPNSTSIIFGSELVYSTLSVEALASTVDYLLQEDGVFYQVIQSRREGVEEFCAAMHSRGYICHIARVPKHYYEKTNTLSWRSKGQEDFLFYTWRKPVSRFPIMRG